MKKTIFSLILIMGVLFTAGCSNGNTYEMPESPGPSDKPVPSSENDGDPSEGMTLSEVLQSIKQQIETDVEIKLPTKLPLEESEYLTARVESDENSYSVVFYKSSEAIEINDSSLSDDNGNIRMIGILAGEKMSAQQQADETVGFNDFSEIGGIKIDLGYDITGYQDAGAGSVFTSWNEGRWSLISRSRISESEKGEELARNAVDFLESNALPAPHPYGSIRIVSQGEENKAVWQEEQTVYSLDKVSDAMDMLEMMVSIN